MTNKLHILYGCDDHYAPYAGVSITSLFENNRDASEITVYLAGADISTDNQLRFQTLADTYNRNIVFLDTTEAIQKIHAYHCSAWNGSLAIWLRFFVLDQIPTDVDHLLYLDSDTIVLHSLGDLFSMSMGDFPVACCADSICYGYRFFLGLSDQEPYFNSGVILFNLPRWREQKLLSSFLTYGAASMDKFRAPDQDLLNDFFRRQIMKLPVQYNFQGTHLAYSPKQYFACYAWLPEAYYSAEEVQAASKAPVVIHVFRFLGDYPWEQGKNLHPAKPLYEEWLAKSPWAGHKGSPCNNRLVFRIEKLLYQCLPKTLFLKIFKWVTNRNLPQTPIVRR